MLQVAYAIIWWLILLVIGLITFPLVSRVCSRLPDKCYSILKILGLPTVIGLATHEVMWRGSWDKVAGQDTNVNTIYQTSDSDESLALLRKYNVEYIYIGKLEKERYPAESLQKFANDSERYKLVYQNQDVSIYQVIP